MNKWSQILSYPPNTSFTTWLRRSRGAKNRPETLQEHFWPPRPSHHDTQALPAPITAQRPSMRTSGRAGHRSMTPRSCSKSAVEPLLDEILRDPPGF